MYSRASGHILILLLGLMTSQVAVAQNRVVSKSEISKGYASTEVVVPLGGVDAVYLCRRVGNNLVPSDRLLAETSSPAVDGIVCNRVVGDAFAADEVVLSQQYGHEYGRAWVDANGDGQSDFCRVLQVDPNATQGRLACTLSTGTGFGRTIYFPEERTLFDAGYHANRTWKDVNGDGTADYCALKGNPPNVFGECVLSLRGGGFGSLVRTDQLAVPCFLTDIGCVGDEPVLPTCAIRTEIARIEGVPEFKLDLSGLQTRTSALFVYADACVPDDIRQRFAADTKDCLRVGATGAVIAALLASPEAAIPGFQATVTACMVTKGVNLTDIDITIWTRQRVTSDWKFVF